MKSFTLYSRFQLAKHTSLKLSWDDNYIKKYRRIKFAGAVIFSFCLSVLIFSRIKTLPSYASFENGAGYLADIDSVGFSETKEPEGVGQERYGQIVGDEDAKSVVDKEFGVGIAKLNAYYSVVSDVDPFNEENYSAALKKGVAHAKNTGNPGEGRSIYLFAHSTSSNFLISTYNAYFYGIWKLVNDDEIVVKYAGNEYKYRVFDKKIVSADDISWLYYESELGEVLMLQTCYPPGTRLKRLIVFGSLVR